MVRQSTDDDGSASSHLPSIAPAVKRDEGAGVDGAALLHRRYQRLVADVLIRSAGAAAAGDADALAAMLPGCRREVQQETCAQTQAPDIPICSLSDADDSKRR